MRYSSQLLLRNVNQLAQIVFITPKGGLRTSERIFNLIQEHPQGITVRELSERLNRPISMINICLKELGGKVKVRLSHDGLRRVYFPK